ncbi:MAG TPA: 30S ribosomal protein THX [Rhodanobacteraceae bacterium]|nr:30S ribosomal protein THX [Rhodanobacteraceae bacterium]
MGKGDRKTRRGKINSGSYGNKRPHADKPASALPRTAVKKAARKSARSK